MAARRNPFFMGGLGGGGGGGGPTHSSAGAASSSSSAPLPAGVSSFADPYAAAAAGAGALDVHLRYIRFLQPSSHCAHALHQFYSGVLKMTQESAADLGPDRSRLVFVYPGDKVGLRFEYERYGNSRTKHQQQRQAQAQSRAQRWGPAAAAEEEEGLPTAPTTSVSLLLYVDSVAAFVARAREHAFVVWLEPVTLSDPDDPALLRTAVLLDPLGIKVRLMEGEGCYPRAGRSHARLGYVSLPVKDYAALERSVKFYDAVFRPGQTIVAPTALPKRSSNAILAAHQDESAAARKSDPALAAAASKAHHAHGFRLVDMERFVEEMLTYFWLANGPRRKHAAVCLTHQVARSQGGEKASGAGGAGGERTMEKTSWAAAGPQQPMSADAAAEAAGATGADASASAGDDDDDDDDESLQTSLGLLDRKLATLESEDAPLFLGLSLACPDMEQAVSHLALTEVGRNAAAAAAAASVVAAAVAAANAGVSPTADPPSATATATAAPSSVPAAAGARLEVQHIAGFPRFISFLDPAGIPLELSDGVQGVGALSAASAAASIAAASNASLQSMMGLAGGVGSATAAALLMRSNMMRAQAGTAAMAAASAAAAAAAAKSSSAAAAAAAAASRAHAPLSFTPSPASTRAGSPAAMGDDWSDGEGGAPARRSTPGRPSRAGARASSAAAADSDASVSDDDDAPAAGLGSYVEAALHYSGSGGGTSSKPSRYSAGGGGVLSSPHRPRVVTASRARTSASPSASPSSSTSRSPSRPHSSHPSKPMSPAAPHAPATPRSGRSRPNSSKVRS